MNPGHHTSARPSSAREAAGAAHDGEGSAPSPWVTRWAPLVPAGGGVLDIASGAGRHTTLFAALGHPVLALDRDLAALRAIPRATGIECVCADLENAAWPLSAQARFAGVVVTRYLHRPLLPRLPDLLAPGGVLIYETFAAGHETVGRPVRADFLLRPGELLETAAGRLRVIAFEDGFVEGPRPAFLQRLCAVRESGATAHIRYNLGLLPI